MSGQLVLVTGGSGFIAAHCIVQLLQANYKVRTTVRSLKREPDVRKMVKVGGANLEELPASALSFATADLMSDDGWQDAVSGCEYVLHVASPFPAGAPKHEDDLIIPAREGTLRVLRAARDTKVKRVVLTSSFAAIGYGHPSTFKTYTEADWTNLEEGSRVSPYAKSKTLAEKAAWDFMAREGGDMELAVVNPVGVFGPALGSDSTSISIVQKLMDGELPGLPKILFGVVDVRDVADLHLRAMTSPAAKGERFLAVSGDFMPFKAFAEVLRSRYGESGRKITSWVLPNWLVRFIALFDKTASLVVPELGVEKNGTSGKASRLLGWQPRSREDAIVASAESLLALGLLKSSKK